MSKEKKYGLLISDIEIIISVLEKNKRIENVVLFGSRAMGTFNNGSDIDIALKGENLTIKDINEASVSLEDLLFPYKLDFLIYERIQEKALIEHINRVGISLYSKLNK